MSAPPAFQFYTDDFLGGVSDMTQGEVGAYILLLCQQWNRGSIPVQPDRQRLLAKGDVTDHVLAKFREDEDGLLRNRRMELERQKQAQFREAQRVKGQKSGQSRRTGVQPGFNRGSTEPPTGGQPEVNSPITDHRSPLKKSTPLPPDGVSNLLSLLGSALYRRPKDHWPTEPEQRLAIDVLKRPNWKTEVETILAFNKRLRPEDRRFQMPHSLSRLLSDWNDALDKARTYQPIDSNGQPRTPGTPIGPRPHVDAEWREEEMRWV